MFKIPVSTRLLITGVPISTQGNGAFCTFVSLIHSNKAVKTSSYNAAACDHV